MKLNPDCIRDILMVVEANSDGQDKKIIHLRSSGRCLGLRDRYDMDTISYLLQQCAARNYFIDYKHDSKSIFLSKDA